MAETRIKKQKFDGTEVEIVGETYDGGLPDGPDKWRGKMGDFDNMISYIKTAQRYYYGESYGSEKRKNPA